MSALTICYDLILKVLSLILTICLPDYASSLPPSVLYIGIAVEECVEIATLESPTVKIRSLYRS